VISFGEIMAARLLVADHLTEKELRNRAENAENADERMRWIAILQKKLGKPARLIADFCNRKEDWVRRTVRIYNEKGPSAIPDGRVKNGRRPHLDQHGLEKLRLALKNEEPPGGGLWNGPKVSTWIGSYLRRKVCSKIGWKYLAKRLKWSAKTPRPVHPGSDKEAKEAFKKGGSKKP
jgi:hypothetical protein